MATPPPSHEPEQRWNASSPHTMKIVAVKQENILNYRQPNHKESPPSLPEVNQDHSSLDPSVDDDDSWVYFPSDDKFAIAAVRTLKIPAISPKQKATSSPHASEFDTLPMMVLKDISSRQGVQTPVMQSELSGAAGGAAIVGIGNIVGSILKFGTNYLLQVGFGAALYGLYSVCLSLVQFVASLCNLGLGDTTIRYTAIYHGQSQRRSLRGLLLFSSLIASIMGTLGATFILFFSPIFIKMKHEADLQPILWLLALMVPLLCLQTVWLGSLQGLKLFKHRVLAERIFIPATLLLLVLAAFFFRPGILSITFATVASTAIGTVVSAYYLYQALAKTLQHQRQRYRIREWLSFATFNFLTSMNEVVLESIDTLLLVVLAVADSQIGQYNAAVKISDFIAMPLFSLNTMFAPTIAELHSKREKQKLGIMYKVVNKWIITLSLPLFFVSALFSQSLLQLSGKSFFNAWPLLVVSALASMINAATGSVGYMLLMTGHQKICFLNSLLSVALNVVLGVLLIPHYGAMGTALGITITLALTNILRFLQVRHLLKLQPYSWDTLKPIGAGLLSALVTALLLFLLRNTALFLHLAIIPLFLVAYVACLILFKISPEDALVLDALRKKFIHTPKRDR